MKPRLGDLHRIYLAAGPSGLDELLAQGELSAPGFVVTDAMRVTDSRADEEDLEYEALLAAEEYLRERGEVPVVVAADVASAEVGGGEADTPIPTAQGGLEDVLVPRERVVAVHVPEPGAPEDEELLWFDVSELEQARRVAADS